MSGASLASFAGLIGERFSVSSGPNGPGDTLVLAAVESERRADPEREAFSLIFHGSASIALPHDTLLVRHPAIGDHAIFMGPIARDADKTTYQAVFS